MGQKRELCYLRTKIMIDMEQINLLLDFISSFRVETLAEASILASLALTKGKNISRNNEKIGKILKH